jgi:hypothetical protein
MSKRENISFTNDIGETEQIQFYGFDQFGDMTIKTTTPNDVYNFYLSEHDAIKLIEFLQAKIKDRE